LPGWQQFKKIENRSFLLILLIEVFLFSSVTLFLVYRKAGSDGDGLEMFINYGLGIEI
jgi:hypothetical protein